VRRCFGLILAAALAEGAALMPAPRVAKLETRSLSLKGALRVRLAPDTPASRFALSTLESECARGKVSVNYGARPAGPHLFAGLASHPEVRGRLNGRRLDKPQSYWLRVEPDGIFLAASDEAGLFYGVQTLRQLMRVSDGRIEVPVGFIEDWPELPYRGLSIDVSRGPVPTEERLQAVVRTMAEFKMNMLTLYMEHVFPYSHAPLVAPRGTEITPEMLQRLSAYAARYHVDLVPQQQMFGHMHNMLKLELYSDMAETPYGSVLAPAEERVYEWIEKAARELAEAMPSRFLHIGCDETFELGAGRSRELAARMGVSEVYRMHLERVARMLAPLNRRLMFWGDIALSHPELLPRLPKDLVAMTWDYDPKPDYTPQIAPFLENGMEVFVCPGLNNWHRIYPGYAEALANINAFVRDGKKLGAKGMLNTHWVDGGEALFGLNWYGIVYSAAAAWQPGEVDPAAFAEGFDWVFHRRQGRTIATVVERLMRAHKLFEQAGLRYASEQLFWMDPFSKAGAHSLRLALPFASEIRKLAEQSLVDLEDCRKQPAARDSEFVFLELACRRLNYLGMKIQFSSHMAERYRALAEKPDDATAVRRGLRRISGTNGLVEDLREAMLELKALYRAAWLSENQPYWLDNVLIRYDAEALYWQQKANLVARLWQEYQVTKRLPPPAEAGFELPE